MGHAVAVADGSAVRAPRRRARFGVGAQWALLLLAGALVWGLWPAAAVRRHEPAARRVEHDGFLAVAYAGVSQKGGGLRVTSETLRGHLEALIRAGYSPVTLEEVRAFVAEREPLPDRPLLLLFEDGRRETLLAAEKLLEERDIAATLVAHVAAMDRRSMSYPLWHHLRALAATGRWSFAVRASSELEALLREAATGGEETAAADGDAESAAARSEPEPAWRERLAAETEVLAAGIADRLGTASPVALVLAGAARGTAHDPARQAVHAIVGGHFPLLFAAEGYAFNHRDRPASGLSVLRVAPEWTGDELVRRLDAHRARRSPVRRFSERDWVFVHGAVACDGACVHLDPQGRRGAEAWLAGTESWQCLSGALALEPRADTQVWLLLRAQPGGDSLRLGWTGEAVELQARSAEGSFSRLASVPVAPGCARAEIEFRVLDRRVRFAVRGGEPVPRSFPIPLGL
ncbi:MAG: hypothetical protein JXQ29_12715, partial [Planctomycetes bacterium]|nr:hypothetical protein [Planctomycetota bacterium]